MAKGVHQNCISMAEGVADPIDAMFHGFEGSEWWPIDVCHAYRDDNVKRFPTMIAEYYMGGIVAGKTLNLTEHKHSSMLCLVSRTGCHALCNHSELEAQYVTCCKAEPAAHAVSNIYHHPDGDVAYPYCSCQPGQGLCSGF